MFSRHSQNSPSSIPSPTYQWTKARLAYIMSNFFDNLPKESFTAVEWLTAHTVRGTFAAPAFGTRAVGRSVREHLKVFGVQSANFTEAFAAVTAFTTSIGIMSPRYIRQALKSRASSLSKSDISIISLDLSTFTVISDRDAMPALSAFSWLTKGPKLGMKKCKRGKGARYLENSVMSARSF